MRKLLLLTLIGGVFSLSNMAEACDPCAFFFATKHQGHTRGKVTLAVSNQYTDFDKSSKLKDNSLRDGELVRSINNTQFNAAYDFTDNFGTQLVLPFIHRRFDEIKKYRAETHSESGIGDTSFIANYSVHNYLGELFQSRVTLHGGIKFPTGDTGVLEDVSSSESSDPLVRKLHLRHHPIGNASGGRALSLGTGSYDYITGISGFARWERAFFLSYAQYTIRTEGDFNYEFADDLFLSAGPGVYLTLSHESSTALRAAVNYEEKGKDSLNKVRQEGSQYSNLFFGPELIVTYDHLTLEVGADFRVSSEDKDSQVVPDFKLRTSLVYRF